MVNRAQTQAEEGAIQQCLKKRSTRWKQFFCFPVGSLTQASTHSAPECKAEEKMSCVPFYLLGLETENLA